MNRALPNQTQGKMWLVRCIMPPLRQIHIHLSEPRDKIRFVVVVVVVVVFMAVNETLGLSSFTSLI